MRSALSRQSVCRIRPIAFALTLRRVPRGVLFGQHAAVVRHRLHCGIHIISGHADDRRGRRGNGRLPGAAFKRHQHKGQLIAQDSEQPSMRTLGVCSALVYLHAGVPAHQPVHSHFHQLKLLPAPPDGHASNRHFARRRSCTSVCPRIPSPG